jgi:hypothetical protein
MNMLVKSAATTTAIPISLFAGSASAEADPVFAAIERHKWAYAEYSRAVRLRGELEDRLPKQLRKWDYNVEEREPPADCTDDPSWLAAELNVRDTGEEEGRASTVLVDTVPSSVVGLRAFVDYFRQNYEALEGVRFMGDYENGEPMFCDMDASFMDTVAASLHKLAA